MVLSSSSPTHTTSKEISTTFIRVSLCILLCLYVCLSVCVKHRPVSNLLQMKRAWDPWRVLSYISSLSSFSSQSDLAIFSLIPFTLIDLMLQMHCSQWGTTSQGQSKFSRINADVGEEPTFIESSPSSYTLLCFLPLISLPSFRTLFSTLCTNNTTSSIKEKQLISIIHNLRILAGSPNPSVNKTLLSYHCDDYTVNLT